MNAIGTPPSNPLAGLATEIRGRSFLKYQIGRVLFHQGDPALSVYYIHEGKVELTVVSHGGRHGVIGILQAGDFLGEECLAGRGVRIATAKAIAQSSVITIVKELMTRLLHEMPSFAEYFGSCLVSRNIRLQEDLIDQLLNPSEKRLARALLLLAGTSKGAKLEPVVPGVSQETLAQMIGASRQRVNFLMNKFRRLGLVEYDNSRIDGILVHGSLLDILMKN